jgi:erythromycin esterase
MKQAQDARLGRVAMLVAAACVMATGTMAAVNPDGAAPRRSSGRYRCFELRPGIYTFDGYDHTLPTDDLAVFGALVGEAEVVGLGESVHTSGGYYRSKQRLFRFLVEELGFRAFAFESPWSDADLVKAYVETCEGDARTAVVDGLFGVWACETVLEMVEWMCEYNQAHPDDPVTFWGFDIQQPWDDGPLLMSYVTANVENPGELIEGIERCNGATYESASAYDMDPDAMVVDEEDHAACLAALDSVESYFDDHEAELVAATSTEALAWARISLIGLRAWEGEIYYYFDDIERCVSARDEGMAEVFLAIKELRNPDDRVAIWAHNWHIVYHSDEMYPKEGFSMGSHLKQILGNDYFALGLIGYEVSVDWPSVGTTTLSLPTPSSVEARLHRLGYPYLFVDLGYTGADAFLVPGQHYPMNDYWTVPGDQFGALLFLDVSPPMVPLGW